MDSLRASIEAHEFSQAMTGARDLGVMCLRAQVLAERLADKD